MRVLLLNISDIHVQSQDKPENEGLVLRRFIDDVDAQVKKIPYDDVFVLISGDLVFAASKDSYAKFDEVIVQELMRVLNIDRSHFIIAPGNHDVTQNAVKDVEDAFLPIFDTKYRESKFNDFIIKKAQRGIVFGKFDAFQRYMHNTMKDKAYSLQANIREINDEWSVHILNSAILSCGAYKNIDDQGHLGVDTRSLHRFLREDNHPKKILLMHHPEYFCMDWVKTELRKLYSNYYALVLSGHTHDQYIYCDNKESYIRCEAPQLFTDKFDDILGYNFIELDGDKVAKITYRQWSEKRNKFKAGSDFVDDDDSNGVIIFNKTDMVNQEDVTDRTTILNDECLKHKKELFSIIHQGQTNDTKSNQTVTDSHHQSVTSDENMPYPQAVDLGLPSGTLWASCNVGATKPEENGGYFAWGETEEKDFYDWITYKHCDGSEDTCHNLGVDIASTQYDVAYIKLGCNWRIPTYLEFKELIDNCRIEWVSQEGVKGRKFTGPNGKSIFLPAAGRRLHDGLDHKSRSGLYWTSMQIPGESNRACDLGFNSNHVSFYNILRCDGQSVRPVSCD